MHLSPRGHTCRKAGAALGGTAAAWTKFSGQSETSAVFLTSTCDRHHQVMRLQKIMRCRVVSLAPVISSAHTLSLKIGFFYLNIFIHV